MANEERQQAVLDILRNLWDLDGLKRLFWEELNYERENKPLSPRKWPDSARKTLAEDPILFAGGGEGTAFHVVYCRINSSGLKRGAERPIVNQLLRDHPYSLFVFSNKGLSDWHFLNVKYDEAVEKRRLLRRITVRPGDGLRTASERMAMLDLRAISPDLFGLSPLLIQQRHDEAFDVEKVTKDFYKEIANWYFWALRHVKFPKNAPKEKDGRDHISVIRLITRLIFCWFIREKGLIPDVIFDRRRLAEMLDGFAPDKPKDKESVFYRAILQNLFFATLNTEMDQRGWRRKDQNFMAHCLYRHKDCFRDPAAGLEWFKNIPFLNGGLFECLDRDLGEDGCVGDLAACNAEISAPATQGSRRPGDSPRPCVAGGENFQVTQGRQESKERYLRVDGFSDREDSRPTVPDFLFFGPEQEQDLSDDYGDKKFRKVWVRGVIDTLNRYKFTIEENTPFDQEVALDPELCGKVFENLLAAYNPETGTSARKATGSFYTPREIVDYMVDESLAAYLKGKVETAKCAKDANLEDRLRALLAYNDESHGFSEAETEKLIDAIDNLKALDPACGSGAFPMGLLHKLVHALGKLDPDNEKWKAKQIAKLDDAVMREEAERVFKDNYDNYGRKLYLIENCIYGVDIQPIAVQIAKMRFFISLIVDQRVNAKAPNLGVRALPNLETKFVAANTLIGIERQERQGDLLTEDAEAHKRLTVLRKKLAEVRHRHFSARTNATKVLCRKQDRDLRKEMSGLLDRAGLSAAMSRQLAAWDPYNQNASSPFFDPEWMFGVNNGFDIVIGNPPYISHDKIPDKHVFARYETYEPFADIYCYFIERTMMVLKVGGILSFITSNSYIKADYGSPLRRLLGTKHGILQLLNIETSQVFESVIVNVAVLLVRAGPINADAQSIVTNASCDTTRITDYIARKAFTISTSTFQHHFWTLAPEPVLRVKQKIADAGQTLEELGTKIRLGIATGANEAFIITENKRRELISKNKKNNDIIKPILRGRDIDRYTYSLPRLYVLLTKNGVNVKQDYPDIYSHLESFGPAFKRRGAQGQNWWNLRACAFFDDFEREKVVWIELSDKGRFALCRAGIYLINSAYFLLPPSPLDAKYLLAVLNSRVIQFYLAQIAETSGMGTTRWINNYVKEFPIPIPQDMARNFFLQLVDRILAAKKADPGADTTALEREIDVLVYKLYGLTEEEIRIVEGGK